MQFMMISNPFKRVYPLKIRRFFFFLSSSSSNAVLGVEFLLLRFIARAERIFFYIVSTAPLIIVRSDKSAYSKKNKNKIKPLSMPIKVQWNHDKMAFFYQRTIERTMCHRVRLLYCIFLWFFEMKTIRAKTS